MKRREQLLEYIRAEAAHGNTPSYEEMARHLGFRSKGSAWRLVNDLMRRGELVRTERGRHRSIELAEEPLVATVRLSEHQYRQLLTIARQQQISRDEAARVLLIKALGGEK